MADKGYVLARGDRRGFVVVDPHGKAHNPARHIDGAKTKDVKALLSSLDPDQLPSVAEARTYQAQRPREVAGSVPASGAQRAAQRGSATRWRESATPEH